MGDHEKLNIKDKWISSTEAMKKLGIMSKTTLQKYFDEGKIRFTRPHKKIVLYDVDSIDNFLNNR